MEQAQRQCSPQAGDPSSFSFSPQDVTAVAAVRAVLRGRAARYPACFRYGKSTFGHQSDKGSSSSSSWGTHPAMEYYGSEMQLRALLWFSWLPLLWLPCLSELLVWWSWWETESWFLGSLPGEFYTNQVTISFGGRRELGIRHYLTRKYWTLMFKVMSVETEGSQRNKL